MKSSSLKRETSTQRSTTASRAFSRWKIIERALYGQWNNTSKNEASIRQFSSFGLFDVKEVGEQVNAATEQTTDQINCEQTVDNETGRRNEQKKEVKEAHLSSEQKEAKSNRHNETSEPSGKKEIEDRSCVAPRTVRNEDDKWYYYSLNYKETVFQIKLKFASNKIPIKELFKGFDFSGSYFWPSEEILSYFCFKNSFLFDKLSVCEIGCGMAGLAGLTVAIRSRAKYVLLTDGNARCMENVANIVKENVDLYDQTVVRCKLLKWRLMSENSSDANQISKPDDEQAGPSSQEDDLTLDQLNLDDQFTEKDENLANKFEILLCSDCLYFEKSHLRLIETIYSLLSDNGTAIIMAPLRKNSFKDFMKLACKYFHLRCHIVYDDIVWQLNRKFQRELTDIYSTSLHYPLMAILTKRQTILN